MSLRPQPIGSIPEQTARVAHAAFPKGHPYLTLRDHLGTIFQDEDFAALYPAWGYPRAAPVAAGPRHDYAVPRTAVRPPGGRGGASAHRLEVSVRAGTDGPWLRLFRALRIPRPLAGWERCITPVRQAARTVSHHGVAHRTRPATHRLDPRARGHSCDEPPRTGRRNSPGCAQCVGHSCTHVAPSAGPSRMVRALWHAD